MDNTDASHTFRWMSRLGYAGILPQALAVSLFVTGTEWAWIALAAGFAYAALIFSFLGGVWWGQAMACPKVPQWAFVAAIMPSLIGLALFIPWTLGWAWPEPSLIWLGLFLILSPLVDARLGLGDAAWMRLRWQLSLALGSLTLILGVLALAIRP